MSTSMEMQMTAPFVGAPDRASAFLTARTAATLLQRGHAEFGCGSRGDGGVLTAASVLHVASDAEIYGEGDDARAFYKVVRGVVRTCKFLKDGRRQIMSFYEDGEVFGFEAGTAYGMTAEAVTDCSLASYRRKGLEQRVVGNVALAQQVLDYLMDGITRAQAHALLLGRRSALERVGVFLHGAAQRSADGRTIKLALTRQDMADYLGLTIETVSRSLSQLEREGVIVLPTARHIEVDDAARLERLTLLGLSSLQRRWTGA